MANPHEELKDNDPGNAVLKGKWPDKNTAFLVVHGIGNQKPIETLDQFARGIVDALDKFCGDTYEIKHLLEPKATSDPDLFWFDNFLRISRTSATPNEQKETFIDIYEYYWANLTEDKTNIGKIQKWLRDVTTGALKYYSPNETIAETYEDKSIFTNSKGEFSKFRYFVIMRLLGSITVIVSAVWSALIKFISIFPFGFALSQWLEKKKENTLIDITNVLGDITIYNDPNPRSSNQEIRSNILTGCTKAIHCLIVPDHAGTFHYDRVVVAGHSLGSQVTFDAINRLTHAINLGKVNGYDRDGNQIINDTLVHPLKNISDVLDTYFTFGSPLDKIAFFLREQYSEEEYLRKQMLENFHCFKQQPWAMPTVKGQRKISSPIKRIFDKIVWKNYYDNHDIISGPLDYYKDLTNVKSNLPPAAFTHCDYWKHSPFYADILKTIFR